MPGKKKENSLDFENFDLNEYEMYQEVALN